MSRYSLIKRSILLGENKIKNRVVSSPISTNMANNDGTISENVLNYFGNLAANDIGMVTVGAASVSKEGGDAVNGIHIGGEIHEYGLKKLASKIINEGSTPVIQVYHVGAQGNAKYSKQRVVGPSKYMVPDIGTESEELNVDEIIKIENEFVDGIVQAFDCGFRLVEIHLGHGYLLHEFLSSHMNKRNDLYGSINYQ